MSARDEAAGGGDGVDRYKLQPALAHAAEAACSYFLTDGFCSPRQCQQCKCWDRASAVMDATGLSARAVGFIFQHRQQIEKSAEEQETKTWDGTPWWSKPEALARDEANRRSPSPRDQASSAMLGALEAAIDRCELFLSTFEDVGDCATRADISDWIDAAKAARSAGIETEGGE